MKILMFIFSFFIVSNISAKDINVDELYAKAIILYEQGKQTAFSILEQAAALGNTDAMCLLGDANNIGLLGNSEANKWYQMAAQHEAPCGYMSLLDSNEVTEFIHGKNNEKLEKEFLDKTIPKAEGGDAKSSHMLSYFYGKK